MCSYARRSLAVAQSDFLTWWQIGPHRPCCNCRLCRWWIRRARPPLTRVGACQPRTLAGPGLLPPTAAGPACSPVASMALALAAPAAMLAAAPPMMAVVASAAM